MMHAVLPLLFTVAFVTGSAADGHAPAASALGIFANADAVPELQAPAFVGTVFVPNDAGAPPCAIRPAPSAAETHACEQRAQRWRPSCAQRS